MKTKCLILLSVVSALGCDRQQRSEFAAESTPNQTIMTCDGGAMTIQLIPHDGTNFIREAVISEPTILSHFQSRGIRATADDEIVLRGTPIRRDQYPLPIHQLAGQGPVVQSINDIEVDGYIFNDFTGVKVQWKKRAKTRFECPEGSRIAGEGFCARRHPSCGENLGCRQEVFFRGRTIELSPEREVANWYFQRCDLQN